MDDEEGFLGTIKENKADIAPRLVYADWLEERGDFRSDLIRIEEEMRRLPVYSDRFWELKPQRNQLRAQAPSHWLEAMNYTRHSQLIFAHGIPDGWKERWRIIREFTERWHGIPMGDVGGRQAEIAEAEERLGKQLPPSVREYVAFAQDLLDDPQYMTAPLSQDVFFRGEYALEEIEGCNTISILQNQGREWWGVEHEMFDQNDPPVLWLGIDSNYSTEIRGVRSEGSVTSFVFDDLLANIGNSGSFRIHVSNIEEIFNDLEKFFPTRSVFGNMTSFETEDVLIRIHRRESFHRIQVTANLAENCPKTIIPEALFEHARKARFAHRHGVFRLPEDH